jgi:hypothetical protein
MSLEFNTAILNSITSNAILSLQKYFYLLENGELEEELVNILNIDIDENNMVCISFLPPALPLTQNLLDQIEEFNKTTNYKAEYFERYLNIYLPYYSLFTDNVEVTTVKMIIETINDPVFLEMVRPHLKYYSCPNCGGIVELDYPYDADDYVYHCSSCHSDYSITEITGITDYIDEYK